ncbi:OFA family MFS transporter [uncultured Klebsiella sp.]|uniref:L-lactate MFS transporter n=1 Tax=uncultured Klebsiella sp. TaxID=284011 RepID=UPI0028054372|nr:OFA family MFS transporter [uncultured Klebsiella sp.]
MKRYSSQRWLIFLAAWIIIFFIASAAIFSVFSSSLAALHGWTLSEVTLSFSIYQLFLGVVGIFGGRFADRKTPIPLMYIGGLLFGAGWFLTGHSTTLAMLYLTFGVLAGTGAGLIYNATLATALRWFPDMKGKVSGLLLAAAAFGPFVLAPLTNLFLTSLGRDDAGIQRTFHSLGLIFFIAIALVGWLMRKAPDDITSAKMSLPTTGDNEGEYHWLRMLKTRMFWILFFVYMCAGTAGTMMISSTAIIAQSQFHLTTTIGAFAVSISTIANFLGRLSFGVLIDKYGDFQALLISLVLTTIALLLLGISEQPALFFFCVALLGFSFGAPLVIFPPITSRQFGSKNLGINYGIMFLGFTAANYVGPRIAANFKDSYGNFIGAYFTSAAIAIVGAVIVILLIRREKTSTVRKSAALQQR